MRIRWLLLSLIISGPLAAAEPEHWAYVAPTRPPAPTAGVNPAARQNIQNPIDSFVLARLDKEGLNPSPEADKRTLLRRVSFDLTGLPPSPTDVKAFLDDPAPNAYEKIV